MKVKGFTVFSAGVRVDVSCSKCGAEVSHTFSYCPKCGRKLCVIAPSLPYDRVCELITSELRDAAAKEEMKHILIVDSVDQLVDHKDPPECKTEPVCPRCKASALGCEFLMHDGQCMGVVYPTYPPQYDRCVLLKPGETPPPIIKELSVNEPN